MAELGVSNTNDNTNCRCGEVTNNCKDNIVAKNHMESSAQMDHNNSKAETIDMLQDANKNISFDDSESKIEQSLSSLQKDDSGIEIEKSPCGKDGSIAASDLDVSESLSDSGAVSHTYSESDTSRQSSSDNNNVSFKVEETSNSHENANENKPMDVEPSDSPSAPLSADTEAGASVPVITVSDKDGEKAAEEIDKKKERAKRIKESIRQRQKTKRRFNLILDSDDTGDSDDLVEAEIDFSMADEDIVTNANNTAANVDDNENMSESDNDMFDLSEDSDNDDDDDDEMESAKGKKEAESSSESDLEEEPVTKKPKESFKVFVDCRNREYGFGIKTPAAVFRERVHSSVHLVQKFELQYKMDYHEGCVNALNFNRIGTLLASGSDDLNIVLWNWIRNRPALVYESGHRSNVFQAKFMPFSGDCHVVSCARDGQVRLAELSLTGVCKSTKRLAQHKGDAHKLALEMDSPHVFLSCGEDAAVFEIDLRVDKPRKLAVAKENSKKIPLYSIHSNPVNSMEFVVGGRDHFIRIYDKRKIAEDGENAELKKFCPSHLVDSEMKANVTCAMYSYNGKEVVGSYNDEDIYLFSNEHSDMADFIHRYRGHRNNATVKGVNFYGPHSEFIISGSDCGNIFLWDKETEQVVQMMKGDEGGVINVLEPHPYFPVLATSGLDHDVKIWAPTANDPTDLSRLTATVKSNKQERKRDRSADSEVGIDGRMLLYILDRLPRVSRRAMRRQQREQGEDTDSLDGSTSEDSDGNPERIACAPS